VSTLVGLTACGDDGEAGGAEGSRPHVVVTTSILGDMVAEVVGDQAEVEVVMPLGTDPHEFQMSARQAQAVVEADLLVTNGAGFEEGMLDVIENAEASGTPVFAFADHVDLLAPTVQHEEEGPSADGDHDAESGEEHGDGADDPHIWTDPARMITRDLRRDHPVDPARRHARSGCGR
jgi:zinc/manganese transport system substrate-binding protein